MVEMIFFIFVFVNKSHRNTKTNNVLVRQSLIVAFLDCVWYSNPIQPYRCLSIFENKYCKYIVQFKKKKKKLPKTAVKHYSDRRK